MAEAGRQALTAGCLPNASIQAHWLFTGAACAVAVTASLHKALQHVFEAVSPQVVLQPAPLLSCVQAAGHLLPPANTGADPAAGLLQQHQFQVRQAPMAPPHQPQCLHQAGERSCADRSARSGLTCKGGRPGVDCPPPGVLSAPIRRAIHLQPQRLIVRTTLRPGKVGSLADAEQAAYPACQFS